MKAGTLVRRCIGSLIMLAGAAIITLDLVALATGEADAAPPSVATADPLHSNR